MDVCDEEPSFHITFDCTASLRTLLEALSAMFTRGVEFKIVPTGDDEAFLKVEAIDASLVCIVKSSVRCRIVKLVGEPTFTIDTSVLNTCLKSVQAHYSLDIFSTPNSSEITMRLYESIARTHVVLFRVSTMVSPGFTIPPLEDISFRFTLEFDAPTLRNCIRSCRETQANDVKFSIDVPKCGANERGHVHMMVTIAAEGVSVSQERVFHSIVDTQRGSGESSTVIVTEHEEEVSWQKHDDMEQRFSGSFSINYLALFLKCIERHMVTARLETGKPLVLMYPLGSDDSFIVLILAPKLD